MDTKDYLQMDACALALEIKSGHCDPEDILSLAIERCELVNPSLNAVTHRFEKKSRHFLEKMNGNEPFYGVPLLVKELGFSMQGEPSRYGSSILKDHIAPYTDDLMRLYLKLGFVPFAFTNTPEFGLAYVTEPALFGPCKNPYDLRKTPGGSSGGSAAAVASGIAPIATASDGGGSIRIPAACCGLVGFKPSSHLLPTGPGSIESWSGMAVAFAIGRTLKDISRLFLECTAQIPGPALPKFPKCKPKILWCPGAFPAAEVSARWQDAATSFMAQLSERGYQVEESSLQLDHEAIANCSLTLIKANVASDIQGVERLIQRKAQALDVEPITWRFYQDGVAISAAQYLHAKNQLFTLLQPLHTLLQTGNVILSPALAKDPVALGDIVMSDDYDHYLAQNASFSPFTAIANQAGIPAISLPVKSNTAMPLAVQLLMGKWKDAPLLELCADLKEQGLWQENPVVTPCLE